MAIRYRQNINCLSSSRLHDLRETLAAMYALPADHPHSFLKLAGIHGLPTPSYCAHGYPGFFTWHRAYILAFEEAMRCINHRVTLPYWDWSTTATTGVPSACRHPTYVDRNGNIAPNPLYSGPIDPAAGGGMTARAADINTRSFGQMASAAQAAMSVTPFADFQPAINSPHGWVHGNVGGHMGSVASAGFDPIFWLHHANIDRLWAVWQMNHPGPLPANEANLDLEPFNAPYSNQWTKGGDYESTDALGYRYAYCLIYWPPIFREALPLALEPHWLLGPSPRARLVLRIDRMPHDTIELRAFLGEERVTAQTKTFGGERFAGAATIFGMGDGLRHSDMIHRAGEVFDVSIDVTDALTAAILEDRDASLQILPVGSDGRATSEDLGLTSLELVMEQNTLPIGSCECRRPRPSAEQIAAFEARMEEGGNEISVEPGSGEHGGEHGPGHEH